MTVKQFVNEVLEHIENNVCYLAIMPNDDGYDIEVEVNNSVIAGNYSTNTHDLSVARKIANDIEREFKVFHIEVAQSREEWEDYIAQ